MCLMSQPRDFILLMCTDLWIYSEGSARAATQLWLSNIILTLSRPQIILLTWDLKEVLAVERLRRTNPGDPRVGEALLGHDPADTGLGSLVMALKPGDGSAREQAASCQKVLGGFANICYEYATKRYRSNVMNWGMVPFQMEAEPNFEVGDYVFVPGIRAALDGDLKDIAAYVVRADGAVEQIELYIADMTAEERAIVKAGCLINYNKFKAAAE